MFLSVSFLAQAQSPLQLLKMVTVKAFNKLGEGLSKINDKHILKMLVRMCTQDTDAKAQMQSIHHVAHLLNILLGIFTSMNQESFCHDGFC